ncbi:hypothetical protein N9R54_02955 [Pelobium sp.]|nr:hypothetical protein [Pelobium sp.]MDA9555175.1 hypothetical protein [Pelobium sp.]
MSRVKPSQAQLAVKQQFTDAVIYSKQIKGNPELKSLAENRLSNRTCSLYHALIKEYMQKSNT